MPAPSLSSTIVTDPTGHIAARAAIKARSRAYKASNQSRTTHKPMPAGAPRKRAPKVARVPTKVAPHDIAGRLRQMGFRAATGVNYLCQYVAMTGPGTSCGVALQMSVAASRTIEQLGVAIANSPMEGEPVRIWMDPDDCRLLLYWPLPDEEVPPYQSMFGLHALEKRGDTLDIPYNAFPENVSTAAYRQQAVHMDHVLTRTQSSIWIDAIADDARQVVKVTRTTEPYEVLDDSPMHSVPASAGPIPSLELAIQHSPGANGQIFVNAIVPVHLTNIVGAGELVMLAEKARVGIAERHLKNLAGRLAGCLSPGRESRTSVTLCDFEPPY